MGRNILAVVAGVLVTGAVVMGLQWIGSGFSPPLGGLDPTDPANAEALAEHARGLHPATWVFAWGSELLGALLGGIVAGRAARTRKRWISGAIVGLAALGSLLNWIAFPHPAAFITAQLLLYPLVLVSVWRVVAPVPSGAPE